MNLSEEEKVLMEKLGLTSLIEKATKKKKSKETLPEIDLSERSGEVISHCVCCGNVDKFYVDYIKRVDAPGFVISTKNAPSFPINRQHRNQVFSCSLCHPSELPNLKQSCLIAMIKNLRCELRKGVKR